MLPVLPRYPTVDRRLETAATTRVAREQRIDKYVRCCSTAALTLPPRLTVALFRTCTQHQQPTKLLSCQILACVRSALSPVQHLLLLRCPITIIRRVATIIVSSFDRQLRMWSSSHVSEEGREAGSPTLTHFDSAPTVVSVLFISRIVATLLRHDPNAVLWHYLAAPFRTVHFHKVGTLRQYCLEVNG
jgi:hypothetical protein